jgi:hypothetical protein
MYFNLRRVSMAPRAGGAIDRVRDHILPGLDRGLGRIGEALEVGATGPCGLPDPLTDGVDGEVRKRFPMSRNIFF